MPCKPSILVALICNTLWLSAAAHAQDRSEEIDGSLQDGTHWRLDKPANWNGTLLLDLDGAGYLLPPGAKQPADPLNSFQKWLLSQGYAIGGTQREPVGYAFDKAVDNLITVRKAFGEKWEMPRRTLYVGGSRGGFVGRLAMERRPDIFSGALVYSGGGGGSIAGLHDRLNALFALKTLIDPSAPMRIVNVTDIETEQKAIVALVGKANSTPQGRARLALAAAFEQFALWSSRGKPKPAPQDYDAQLDQIAENFAFANPALVRAGVEKIAGGNVSWNTGVDYAALLARSGREPMVRTLYAKAGLDLAGDLAKLARASRIAADPTAVARAERITSYTGKIHGPIVDVDNDDPVDAAPYKLAYLDTLARAGTRGEFKLLWVDGVGHGGQTSLDRAVGFYRADPSAGDGKVGADISRSAPRDWR